jgi:hypothetical protein
MHGTSLKKKYVFSSNQQLPFLHILKGSIKSRADSILNVSIVAYYTVGIQRTF